MLASRLSGLLFAVFGLALYFVIIPYDTELVDYGWVKPQTMPNVMAVTMVACGSVLFVFPAGAIGITHRQALRAALFLVILALGVFAIARLGFTIVAPFLALVLMLATGERRPLWLGVGGVAIPLMIWFTVTVLLGRLLP